METKSLNEIQQDIDDLTLKIKKIESLINNGDNQQVSIDTNDINNIYARLNDLNSQTNSLRELYRQAQQKQFTNNTQTTQNTQSIHGIQNIQGLQNNWQQPVYSYQSQPQPQPQPQKQFQSYPYQLQNIWGTAPRKSKISEVNIGKYIVGVLASILILMAIGLFVSTIWYYITPMIKYSAILALSVSISTLGWYKSLNKQTYNPFWTAVTSCGSAASFIAIISGYIIWGIYDETLTLALVIAWFACNFTLASRVNSIVYYSVAYIGSIIASILTKMQVSGYLSIEELFGIILIIMITLTLPEYAYYKVKSTILLYLNMAYGFIALLILQSYMAYPNSSIIKLAGIIVGIYIFIANNREYEQYNKDREHKFLDIKDIISGIISFVSFTMVSIVLLSYIQGLNIIELESISIALYGIIMTLLIAGGIYIFNKNKEALAISLSPVLAFSLGAVSFGVLKIATLIPLLTLGILVNTQSIRNKISFKVAELLGIIVVIAMFIEEDCDKYNNVSVILTYIVLLIVMGTNYIRAFEDSNKNYRNTEQIVNVLIPFTCIFSVLYIIDIDTSLGILIFAVGIVAHNISVLNKSTDKINVDYMIAKCIYFIIMIGLHISAYTYGVFGDTTFTMICISSTLMLLACNGIYNSLKYKNKLLITVMVLVSNLNLFYLSDIWGYSEIILLVSIVGILLSAAFIGLGFEFKFKQLRVLGLITMIAYVIKAALFDVSFRTGGTALTIFMLLLSGIICFSISFMYNYLNKKYGGEIEDGDNTDGT